MANWPIGTLPRLTIAGRFRLADRGFPHGYRHATLAVHLHGYRARWRCAEGEFQLQPGDLTVSPPGPETRYDIPTAGPCWCFHVEAPTTGVRSLPLPTLHRPRPGDRFFADRFARLVGWWTAGPKDPAAAEAARAAAYEILAALAVGAGEGADEPTSVDRVTAWLDAHYRDEISVARLSRELRLRQDRLSAEFRRRHGCAILDYVARKRVEHAHLLVATTDLPIATVAKLVGIADRRYFTRVFRRVTGVGPRSVRSARR
jgi:AraC-like DNA-binding protein